MKIIRNGQEIELTSTELAQAYEEHERNCMIEDVKSAFKNGEYEVNLSEEQIEEVAGLALHNLSKNDAYFEAYWTSVENTLSDYAENCGARQAE